MRRLNCDYFLLYKYTIRSLSLMSVLDKGSPPLSSIIKTYYYIFKTELKSLDVLLIANHIVIYSICHSEKTITYPLTQ